MSECSHRLKSGGFYGFSPMDCIPNPNSGPAYAEPFRQTAVLLRSCHSYDSRMWQFRKQTLASRKDRVNAVTF